MPAPARVALAGVSRTASFTPNARGGFGGANQRRLAAVFAELDRRGCLVMLSNSYCVSIRTLYRRFRKADQRGLISELVVRNYV